VATETESPVRVGSRGRVAPHRSDLQQTEALLEKARKWLERSGVPHFAGSRTLENRGWHAVVCLCVSAVVAAAFTGLLGSGSFGFPPEVAVTTGLVVVLLIVSLVHRTLAPEHEDPLTQPGKMNLMLAVAVVAGAAAEDIAAGDIRIKTAIAATVALAVVGAIAAATPMGAARIIGWAILHPFREWRQNVRVLAGGLPLLLLAVGLLLLTTELWQVTTRMTTAEFVGALGLFTLIGLTSLAVLAHDRIEHAARFRSWNDVIDCLDDEPARPSDPSADLEKLVNDCLDRAATFDTWGEARAWLESRDGEEPQLLHVERRRGLPERMEQQPGVAAMQRGWQTHLKRTSGPLAEMRHAMDAHLPEGQYEVPPLSWQERGNLMLVVLVGQAVQILALALVLALFFLVFGALTVDETTVKVWAGQTVDAQHPVHQVLWMWTGQHLKVSALLAAFAGLTYAVTATLLKEQRDLFFGELDRKTTQRLAVRLVHGRLDKKQRQLKAESAAAAGES
jgi:hypothetical protein